MAEMSFSPHPYPGLRPFDIEESDIFFGREKQTDELLTKLQQHMFLAVLGPSGCGKSSLVRAGMIASMKVGIMAMAGSRWHVAQMRPGNHPFAQLANALAEVAPINKITIERPDARAFLEESLRRGRLSLIEVAAETGLCQGANLLLLVDQFEELFRFRRMGNENESDAFVQLLLASAEHHELGIYVVITMRSDYLGDCSVFQGLPEAINESQYLAPRLTRAQCAEAIIGPARVFGGDVDDALVNRLLNDISPDPDRLPVLQHALMRMWHRAQGGHPTSQKIILRLEDYEAIGSLDNALSSHADEVLASLSTGQQRITQIMFRRLTERGLGGQYPDTRAPTSLREIAAIASIGVDQVVPVVEAFRKSDRSFITPREGEPLDAEATLDIGHESLIKQWKSLNAWAEAEAESARTYKRLRDTALLWKGEKAALWGTPDLEWALEWEQRERPSEVWARRYSNKPDADDTAVEFSLALSFLRASEDKQKRLRHATQRATRRKVLRLRWAIGSLAAVVAALTVAFYKVWDDNFWPHTNYYSEIVKIWGEPRGIGHLSAHQAASRSSSYRITTRGKNGKVVRVEVVTGSNRLTTRHGLHTYIQYNSELSKIPVAFEYAYDSTGLVAYEFALDHKAERLWGFAYSPSREKTVRTGHYVGPDGYPNRKKPYAGKFVEIEHDDRGREVRIRYLTLGGRPVRGSDDAFGVRKKYDQEGFVMELTSLDPDGKPMNDKVGNATLRTVKRDDFGNILEALAIDPSDKTTVATNEGWSQFRAQADSAGRVTKQTYWNPPGQPTLHTSGYHEVRFDYDGRGHAIKETYWNTRSEPTASTDGCYGTQREIGANGTVTKETCIGPQGMPIRNRRGFSTRLIDSDDAQQLRRETFLDPSGVATSNAEGYAGVRYDYDEHGNFIGQTFLGTDGRPVLGPEGYAQSKQTFDVRGNVTSITYFGSDGERILREEGYASATFEYDDHDLLIRCVYFGTDGKRTQSTDGYGGWLASHDADGREVESWYIDTDDKPVLGKDGYAGWRSDYDKSGNKIRMAYFGIRREPVLSGDGIHAWEAAYDHLGRSIATSYFGLNHKKNITHKNGIAGFRSSYDARGNNISTEYIDIDGNPTVLVDGDEKAKPYSRVEKRYTARNEILEEAYFGVSGEPVLTEHGWARLKNAYDHRGNKVETKYFHVDGNPTLISGGYHRVTRIYDDWRNVIEIAYFDVRGRPTKTNEGFARLEKSYDAFGRLVKQSLYDEEGKPADFRGEGFHQNIITRDERGRETGRAYFDSVGKATLHRNGYHSEKIRYGSRGAEVERAYLDSQNRAVIDKESNCAVIRKGYDEKMNEVEWQCLGTDNRPRLTHEGYSRRVSKFDARNLKTEVRHFGADGRPVLLEAGYASYRVDYDVLRRATGWHYFGIDGKPVSTRKVGDDNFGYADWRIKFDDYGNHTEDRFYGVDHRPIVSGELHHRMVRRFNSRRQPTETSTYDIGGALVMNAYQFARVLRKYDEKGNLLEIAAYDPEGKLSEATYGYARITYRYDARGHEIEEAYWGADNQPKFLLLVGASRMTMRYDNSDNIVEMRYFHNDAMVGRIAFMYDSRRQIVEKRQFDERNALATVEKFSYNDRGELVRSWFVDPHGKTTSNREN